MKPLQNIPVVHFHNGKGGGVQAVISNLVKYSQNSRIQNHIIYVVNKDLNQDIALPTMDGAASEIVFLYSGKWNFYYTAKQLAKLLPHPDAILIAHDWLELGMVSALGLQNAVIQFLHGDYDYYYQLALRHQKQVDFFITVAASIKEELSIRLPQRASDIEYCRFPVPDVATSTGERNNTILFAGRLEDAKGYHLLPMLAAKLAAANVELHWHIAGAGEEQYILKHPWDKNIPVHFYGNISNKVLLDLLPGMKLFILPSLAEGMPVALVEAMKAGAIPITNDINGGIQELVMNEVTGFKIKGNDIAEFAEKIKQVLNDKLLAEKLSKVGTKLSKQLFDADTNTRIIKEKFILVYNRARKNKKAVKIYGSRLDTKGIPNNIVYLLRTIILQLKKV